ncbi:DEAD/DEAH box helicase [Ancylobacter defluvii]|uniref:DEAD/DEAH box helicase n=1 Tax=Ancylobacter defluvii TaxID=1282440 RepID=UPI001BD059DF|nr:DEAD/DEAH box helicase [Ancylobacter defluvii]MBS7587120.1 DEAD/DEAH box helicase [Ancylobacter defluvii]
MKECSLTSFSELGLAEPILKALAEAGHETPTPIQAQAVPQVIAGHDLVGIAQTGTGKTAAFALPILQHLVTDRRRPERRTCRALVLSPTRELAGQILESFRNYGKHVRPSTALAIGGVPLGRQARSLMNGVDVLVATPGRLVDLMENDAVRLNEVEVFVLDEADQMLDMGFIHAIRAIVAKLPAKRRNLFFSATMPKEIEKLAAALLTDPVRVAVTPVAKTADKIEQKVYFTDRAGKPELLIEVLQGDGLDRALVFSRTKHGADRVVKGLAGAGIAAEAIHGNKSQPQRERALAAFREGKVKVLVATDIAARGIDVPGVSHVINYDLPNVPESYVHRIGRTARAGADGIAISLCDGEERAFLRDIERLIKLTIPSVDRRGESRREGRPVREGFRDERPPREERGARPGGRSGRPGGRPEYRGGEARSEGRSGELSGVGFMQPARGERPRHEGARHEGPRYDGPRSDAPRHERPRHEGARHDGPRPERPRQDRPRHEGARQDGPRPEGGRGERSWKSRGPAR